MHRSAVQTRALSSRQPVLQHRSSSCRLHRRSPRARHSAYASVSVAAAPSMLHPASGALVFEPCIQQWLKQTETQVSLPVPQHRMPARDSGDDEQRGDACGRLSVGQPSHCHVETLPTAGRSRGTEDARPTSGTASALPTAIAIMTRPIADAAPAIADASDALARARHARAPVREQQASGRRVGGERTRMRAANANRCEGRGGGGGKTRLRPPLAPPPLASLSPSIADTGGLGFGL